ncbi:NeuD/PglB/VioB family sugar acetyltransferase (plasmid) [Deinococcus sp. VB142]|uniref:NeuD/PglB/VioB family sugar acetyltransferase n=1 Tax=Deinococcus sp. VB142 TaxID=3112952 RepID=A0AAU6Q8D7_9DEIO
MDVVIIGAGGHGRELHTYVEDVNADRQTFNLLGFVDDSPARPEQVYGTPVLGGSEWLEQHPDVMIFLGIGSGRARKMFTERFGAARLASLIHPTAQVKRNVTYGPGLQATPLSFISNDAALGVSVVVNVRATVGHDNRLGDFITVAPHAALVGSITCGDGVEVGVGAHVRQGINLGAWCVVGGGAMVIKDVQPGITVGGIPAKPLTPSA